MPKWTKFHQRKLERLEKIMQEHGAILLSPVPDKRSDTVQFQCRIGHTVTKRYDVLVVSETFCPECAKVERDTRRRADLLERAKKVAHEHSGTLLSETVLAAHGRVSWECTHGHRFEKSLDKIEVKGFCGRCRQEAADRERQQEMLKKIRQEAPRLALTLLSNAYVNSRTDLRWRCTNGHEFAERWGNIQTGHGCPFCAGSKSEIDHLARAREMGGEFLSDEYKGSGTKYLWRCRDGHEFWLNANVVRSNGRWCPIC